MIRKSTENDAQECRRLIEILENCEFDEKEFNEIYLSQVRSGQYVCLLHEENGEIQALLNMRIEKQLHHRKPVAAILEFIVDPFARGKGIGAAMFRYACEYAEKTGCEQIELETSVWRKRAHRFYEANGMIADHLYFTKKLNQ